MWTHKVRLESKTGSVKGEAALNKVLQAWYMCPRRKHKANRACHNSEANYWWRMCDNWQRRPVSSWIMPMNLCNQLLFKLSIWAVYCNFRKKVLPNYNIDFVKILGMVDCLGNFGHCVFSTFDIEKPSLSFFRS